MFRLVLIAVCIALFSTQSGLADSSKEHERDRGHATPYAGQHLREIKTLSAKDIEDLQNGRGWGLAKAAELNGLPGPAHLLELKDKISLSPAQTAKIEALFSAMKARAIPLGKRLVALERRLNQGFAKNEIASPSDLRNQLSEIADVRRDLRFVHLSTHLETPTVLTHHQIEMYNRLRGYGEGRGHGGHRHN
jgi:hypothetical protein